MLTGTPFQIQLPVKIVNVRGPRCAVLFFLVLSWSVLFCPALFCAVPFCSVPFRSVSVPFCWNERPCALTIQKFQLQPLPFQFQSLPFSFRYCSAYTIVLDLSVSVSTVQFQFLLFSFRYFSDTVVPKSSVSSRCSISISAVNFQILLCLHSCSKTFSLVSVVEFPFLWFNSGAALLTQLFKLSVSASAVSISVYAVQLQTLPYLPGFSKSSSFSHCRSISDTAQLTQLFKTFQFQLLLLSLNCCCSVSEAAPFTYVLILSVPVPAVQSPVLLLLFRYSSAYTVVPTFRFQFLQLCQTLLCLHNHPKSSFSFAAQFQSLLCNFRYRSAYTNVLDLQF